MRVGPRVVTLFIIPQKDRQAAGAGHETRSLEHGRTPARTTGSSPKVVEGENSRYEELS